MSLADHGIKPSHFSWTKISGWSTETWARRANRVLEPIDRISEILFGLTMVLTVTCTFSVAKARHEDVRAMIFAALGCNLVWGLVDAILYFMLRFAEQARGILALNTLQRAKNSDKAHRVIIDTTRPFFASVLTPAETEQIYQRLNGLADQPTRPKLGKADWLAAVGMLFLVFLSIFPVVIAFMFLGEVRLALRISNGVALLMLFFNWLCTWGYAGRGRSLTGLVVVLVGVALVGTCIGPGG